MMPFGTGFGGWGIAAWFFWLALMVAFWVGVAFLIVWVIRAIRSDAHRGEGTQPSPLDIAKARYARGEITKEQFEQLKRDLS